MAADTYSARLGLIKQGTGNNNNNWGDIFNASVADLIDRALWGVDTHAVTGGTLDLSAGSLPPAAPSPVAGAVQAFTGVLASNETVTFPSIAGKWTIFNNTTGAFSLLLKTSGMATPIQIPQSTFVDVICDGTTLFRTDWNQVGRTVFHAGQSAPAGTLEMDGSSLLRANYPDLFTIIGGQYGAVDGTHFNLPNLKDTGRFIRSRTVSLLLGTAQSNQNAAHTHTSGTLTGTTNDPGNHAHANSLNDPTHSHTASTANGFVQEAFNGGSGSSGTGHVSSASVSVVANFTGVTISNAAAGAHTHTVTINGGASASSGGTEARPEAIAMIACILY